jgi:hypothetical protein
MVINKACNTKGFTIPSYFFAEKRYLSVSRYPTKDKGIVIPASFLADLDKVFMDLTLLVPFQYNTELKRALAGKDRPALLALRHKNAQMQRVRNALQVHVK